MDLGYNRPTRHGVVPALSRRNPSRSFAAGVVELLIMLSVRQRVSCRVLRRGRGVEVDRGSRG